MSEATSATAAPANQEQQGPSSFVKYLQGLDRGQKAALRNALGQDPGTNINCYSIIEPFASNVSDTRRKALYLTASIYALCENHGSKTFASAFGDYMKTRIKSKRADKGDKKDLNDWKDKSTERRFLTLLDADSENLHIYLSQAARLISKESNNFNYDLLLKDLTVWLNPQSDNEWVVRNWARQFYATTNAN